MCECLDCARVVEDENEVCEFEADLPAEAAADCADCAGCGPGAIAEAGDNDAGAEAAAA